MCNPKSQRAGGVLARLEHAKAQKGLRPAVWPARSPIRPRIGSCDTSSSEEAWDFSPLELPPRALAELPSPSKLPLFPLAVAPEPAVGDKAESPVEIVLRFPDRSRRRRRFSINAKVEQLYAWACAEGADTDVAFFELVIVQGRKALKQRQVSLEEAGITRHTQLTVRRMCK